MFKNILSIIILALLAGSFTACSSSDTASEDTDIAEVQEIESTGEFKEDEFFTEETLETPKEENLVEDIPTLEDEVAIEGETLESNEVAEESNAGLEFEVDSQEGEDLFADLDEEVAEEAPASNGGSEEIKAESLDEVLAGDLNIEGEDLAEDSLFADEGEAAVAETNQAAESGDSLDLANEDDLFRESDIATPEVASDLDVAESSSSQEEVKTDSFVGDNTSSSEPSAAELLAEDSVGLDVDYGNGNSSYGETTVATNLPEKTTTKKYLPVLKMKTIPFSKNGVLANAIYFVRQGDTLSSIGNKIYGSGSAVDFTIVNPHLKAGALKVGQKVYYNSPQRPQDRSSLLTFYEDTQVPASSYSAQKGDNIREISKNLLGHSRSWMEVWASNLDVESKWALEAPFQIRYWQGNMTPAPVAPTMAKVESTPAPVESAPSADLAFNETPEPPAQETMPEEPAFEEPASSEASMENPTFGQEPANNEPQADPFAEEGDAMAAANTEDPFADQAVNSADTGFEYQQFADSNDIVPVEEERDIAKNSGAFPAQSSRAKGLLQDPSKMATIGGALLLLLLVGFLIIRRRRAAAGAPIEMESFDFGGDTVIEDEPTKTQIDL